MKVHLTDRGLKSIKRPKQGRDFYFDELRIGLHLRVGPQKMAWGYEKQIKGGVRRKHTLGSYPSMSLAEARAAALEIEAESDKGIDRVQIASEAKAEKSKAKTLQQVLEDYRAVRLISLASENEVYRSLISVLGPHLEDPARSLTRSQMQSAIDTLIGEGKMVRANRIRAYLRTFCAWATRREYMPFDPGTNLEGSGREVPRDRVLSLNEVQTIYHTTFEMGPLWGPVFRLLLLTAQRRNEILRLCWSNVDLGHRLITSQPDAD